MKSSILSINKTKQRNRANKTTMLYFQVGVASEARIEKIGDNIVFLILKEI